MEFTQVVELEGHIIDSLTLPKVYDEILDRGGNYTTEEISMGKRREDQSYARIKISAPTNDILNNILDRITKLGVVLIHKGGTKK